MNWLLRRTAAYARARLLEASTWRNLILLVGGSWAAAHPDLVSAIVPVCLTVTGAIGSFLPDFFGAQRPEAKTDETRGEALPPIELQGRADPAAGPDPGAGRLRLAVPPDRVFPPEHDERGGGEGWNG